MNLSFVFEKGNYKPDQRLLELKKEYCHCCQQKRKNTHVRHLIHFCIIQNVIQSTDEKNKDLFHTIQCKLISSKCKVKRYLNDLKIHTKTSSSSSSPSSSSSSLFDVYGLKDWHIYTKNGSCIIFPSIFFESYSTKDEESLFLKKCQFLCCCCYSSSTKSLIKKTSFPIGNNASSSSSSSSLSIKTQPPYYVIPPIFIVYPPQQQQQQPYYEDEEYYDHYDDHDDDYDDDIEQRREPFEDIKFVEEIPIEQIQGGGEQQQQQQHQQQPRISDTERRKSKVKQKVEPVKAVVTPFIKLIREEIRKLIFDKMTIKERFEHAKDATFITIDVVRLIAQAGVCGTCWLDLVFRIPGFIPLFIKYTMAQFRRGQKGFLKGGIVLPNQLIALLGRYSRYAVKIGNFGIDTIIKVFETFASTKLAKSILKQKGIDKLRKAFYTLREFQKIIKNPEILFKDKEKN